MYTPLFKIKKAIFLLDFTVIYDISGLMLTFINNPGADSSCPFSLSTFCKEPSTRVLIILEKI
tara:strand:+ start:206 stop:394 length:189 start_codon:yes stop_codon:yes gene_type:complete